MQPIDIGADDSYNLLEAAEALEISFIECQKLIMIGPEANVACWCINAETKEEKIVIGPEAIKMLARHLEMIIRHEILHKYLYKAFSANLYDHTLLNIAEDICINQLLFSAYGSEFALFCADVYGKHPENRQNILCLAWAGLDSTEIENKKTRELYEKIWKEKKIMSPKELYYAILETGGVSENVLPTPGKNPFGESEPNKGGEKTKLKAGQRLGDGDGGLEERTGESDYILRDFPAEGPGDDKNRIEEKIEQGLIGNGKGGAFSSKVSNWFKTIKVERKGFETDEIEAFLARIEAVDNLDEVSSRITSAIAGSSIRQFYPYRLSRSGFVYLNSGISSVLHQYWNREVESRKPRLYIYVDTSPSMHPFKKQEVFLIERFRDLFPSTFYVFAGSVKEIPVDDFIHGTYPAGGSTSFNQVIEHFIEGDAECGVVFTDGESSVSIEMRRNMQLARKRLFTVYFCKKYSGFSKKISSDLDMISEAVMQVNI